MGSSPVSIRFLLQQLECRPHTISWSAPRHVSVRRGANNKLGFHFKTLPYGQGETVTVVVLVKPDCHIEKGALHVGDRIITVCGIPVTGLEEVPVKDVFSQVKSPVVDLQVSVMNRADPGTQIKRFLSVHSGASGGSVTASVDSAERPQVKRLAKSNSTETQPPSPLTDLDQSPVTQLQAPLPDSAAACARYTRYLPHLFSSNSSHIHSLPDRMEDDIILTDDIILVDETNSLPPVLTPLPNTPSPSSFANHHTAKASTVSTRIGGACAVGGDQTNATGYRTLGVEVCRATDCSAQRPCLWHRFVLAYPQYVIWEAFTKTVVLEKLQHSSFGFKYKVKKYDGPPVEVFALVTEVMSGGVAWSQLLPGDWIRSINGTAVNTAKEAFRPDFRSLSSLRLVIQRPEGLSPRGIPRLKQQARSMRINLFIPPPPPEPSSPDHQGLGSQQFVSPVKTDRVGGAGDRDLIPGSSPGSDPLLEQYPRLAQSPGEHIPLATLSRPAPFHIPSTSSDKCVLPWARVVVCGAHGSAADYVRNLLIDSGELEINPEAIVQTFHLSLHHVSGSGVSVRSQPEPLSSVMGESGGLGQEGGAGLNYMNIELYMINNEDFFHHCAAWLLPVSSLVILTFPVHRLLNQPQVETGRLAAMVHTLQAVCGRHHCPNIINPQVLMYGVPSGAQHDVSAEEVQVMFYVTDSGSRLLKDHALSVSVLGQACGDSVMAARSKLFSACQDQACRLPVHQCLAQVVDVLSGLSAVRLAGGELGQMVRRVLGDVADPQMLQTVISDLLATGHLIVCGSNKASSPAIDQEYLLPQNLFQAMSSLLIKQALDSHSPDSRQKWFKLISTGRISRTELVDILSSEASCLTPDMLEHLGIVFRLRSNLHGDSGFAEEYLDFVVPYFLMDTTENGDGVRGQGFVLRFDSYVSWRGYFNMLCELSALPATEEVVVRGQCHSVVHHNGLVLHLQWRKDSDCDSVMVTVSRSDGQSRESVTMQQMERLFSVVVPPVPFKLLPADSSLSSHLPSKSPAASPGAGKASRQHVQYDEEETLLKPAAPTSESADTMHGAGREVSYCDLPLNALPWSVLKQVALHLTVSMATGHDWKSVAGAAGKSSVEICGYEALLSQEVPAMNFLREWMLTAKVQQFLDILEELDRPDVRDIILNHLKERTSQP